MDDLDPTAMTDDELVQALLAVSSGSKPKELTATIRYGVIYEGAVRLRRYVNAAARSVS